MMVSFRRLLVAVGIAALPVLAGCSSSSTTTPPTPTPQTLYVANSGNKTITEYPTTATGNAAPTITITGLPANPEALAVDSAGNLYVAMPSSVEVFAPGASGAAVPLRTITSAPTGGGGGVAIDGGGNLWVADFTANALKEFAPGANGAAVPTNTINVGFAGVTGPNFVTFDSHGNIYVSGQTSANVAVYASNATGNATPAQLIVGGTTTIVLPYGLAVDSANNLYVSDYSTKMVDVFAAGATGNVAPTRSFTVAGVGTAYTIAINNTGLIFWDDLTNSNVNVLTAATATGTATPVTVITGAATTLNGPWGMTIH
ncbi:MAG: hypothetical protein JOY86_02415 [Candidatus Eremiobacteraeota bacterium]|nr:hypothetical protein [Candidatus Eremiobacteraeota bacterium]